MRRWRWIAGSFVVAALLAAAGGALAQSVSYVTVVGPDAAGARLEARAVHGHPCVRVSGSAAGAPTCGGLPGIDLVEPFVLETQGSVRSGAVPLGGAVRAGVARVEYVFKDGRRFAADTVGASRLPGRVGRGVRFFLLELPADARPVTRRLLDAGGRPLDERDDPYGSGDEPAPVRGPVKIATGRRDGARWALWAEVRNRLEPVRGDAGRRVSTVCVHPARGSSGTACQSAARDPFAFDISGSCPHATLLHGLVGAGTRVEVRLGDRRLYPARMIALPSSFGTPGLRAFAFAVPRAAAVQSLRLRSAGGRVQDLPLALQPPQLSCGPSFGVSWGVFLVTSGGPDGPFTSPATVLAPGGGPPLTVRDAGVELCVGVGRRADEHQCVPPAPPLVATLIATSHGGRVVGGALDPRIAAVEARASDGSRRRVVTDPGPAYRGRYAGLVRFFSVAAPRGAVIDSLVLLSRARHPLYELPLRVRESLVGRARVVVTERAAGGRFDLVYARFRTNLGGPRSSCLALEPHGRPVRDSADCLALTSLAGPPGEAAVGIVSCDLRAAIVIGGAPPRVAAVRMRFDDGSTRLGRLFASPLGRGFVAVAPPDRGLRRLELLDRTGRVLTSLRTRVPAAARQCGYGFELDAPP